MSMLCSPVRVVCSIRLVARESTSARWADGCGAPAAGRRAGAVAAIVSALAAAVSLLALGAAPAVADSCPNAQFRTGYAAGLPDCRAYELVTPADAEPTMDTAPRPNDAGPQSVQASTTGDAFGWFSWFNPADVPSFGHYFLSTRGAAGWSTMGVIPPQATQDANLCLPTMAFYSPDLSKGLLADGPPNGALCANDDPPLVSGEPQGHQNLFVRDNLTGGYQLVNVTPSGVAPADAWPLDVSTDISHVVFQEAAQLTPDAPSLGSANNPITGYSQTNLYEWAAGVVRLVTYLPNGAPIQGSFPSQVGVFANSSPGGDYRNPASADGSRVLFTANGNLYLRENTMAVQSPVSGGACTVAADACTLQVDAPQGGSGPGGGGQFMWASTDDSEVFFTDDGSAGLTSDTVGGSGQNLYLYDVDTNTLTDLTPDTQAGVGGVAGASDDGSYVYFEAAGALASGATAGQPNLYVYHDGTTTFIATLAAGAPQTTRSEPADACDWSALCLTSRVSSNGQFIAFNSIESLTGYDNVPANPSACDTNGPPQPSGAPCTEIYLYDAAANALSCASCNPSDAPPTGPTWIRQPMQPTTLNGGFPAYPQRNLSDSGQVFFDSPDALVAQASNGQQNVYEYENGQIDLLSSGTSSDPSFFFDASPSGNDVFIWTTQQLVGQAAGASASIYDVRVDGGYPAPATVPPPCSGDACRGPLSGAPSVPAAASVSFAGPGNVGGSASITGKARVLTRIVHGSTFLVEVRVPDAGSITISGPRVRSVRRAVGSAGTYRLKVALTAAAARAMLARTRELKITLRVGFAPVGATRSTVMVPITVEGAIARHATRSPRRASERVGGAR